MRERVIAAIDMNTGQIARRMTLPGDVAPGNLLVHRGRLISQSATTFAVLAPAK